MRNNVSPVSSTSFKGVDTDTYEKNRAVDYLVKNGFSTDAISAQTGYTNGQIQTRVRLWGLQHQRRDFRHGLTEESQIHMTRSLDFSDKAAVNREINKRQRFRTAMLAMRRNRLEGN